MSFRFDIRYFLLTAGLLVTEVIIARFAHDAFIRPYGGDFLVVILLYCLVKSLVNIGIGKSALGVLLFAYGAETLQYFHFINVLGLERSAAARIIMGTHFEWTDMLMYTLGILLVIIIETGVMHKSLK